MARVNRLGIGLVIFFTTWSLGLVGACSSSDTATTNSADAAPDGSAPRSEAGIDTSVEDGPAAPTCSALPFAGSLVAATDATDDAGLPTDTGGTVVDGTYVLVSAVDYAFDSAAFAPRRETVRIQGSVMEQSTEETYDAGTPEISNIAFRFTTSGTTFSATKLCSNPPVKGQPAAAKYTATADTLVLQFDYPAHEMRWSYKRTP